MTTEMKNALMIVIGAVLLIILGAFGMWAAIKIMGPSTATIAASTPPPAAAATPAVPTVPMAQVVSVEPHYVVQSIPYRKCHYIPQTVVTSPGGQTSGAGAALGGLAGGLAGSQVGEGRGRTAAEIGGAVLGALAGNQVESNMTPPQTQTVYSPTCREHYTQRSVQSGYTVTYIYNGQSGTVHMQSAPAVGSSIPLTLTPAGN